MILDQVTTGTIGANKLIIRLEIWKWLAQTGPRRICPYRRPLGCPLSSDHTLEGRATLRSCSNPLLPDHSALRRHNSQSNTRRHYSQSSRKLLHRDPPQHQRVCNLGHPLQLLPRWEFQRLQKYLPPPNDKKMIFSRQWGWLCSPISSQLDQRHLRPRQLHLPAHLHHLLRLMTKHGMMTVTWMTCSMTKL